MFFKKKNKAEFAINGAYDSSHPDFDKSVLKAELITSESGVDFNIDIGQAKTLKHFNWPEIDGFDYQVKEVDLSRESTSAVKTAAFGLVGHAAKKKLSQKNIVLTSVLYTTSGNVELILDKTVSGKGDIGKISVDSERLLLENKAAKFKKFVLDKIA